MGIALPATRTLLICGVASALYYVVINLVVALQSHGYSAVSQTVSELSAIDAPTRTLWNWLAVVYTVLAVAFGLGVLRAAGGNRRLRIAGWLLFVYGALGVLWPFAPMHQREALAAGGGTMSDTMHLVFGGAAVLLMLLSMSFAAAALGRRFRVYTIASAVALLFFGLLTAIGAPDLQANAPTPLLGVWERVNIGVFLLWVVVLSLLLLQRTGATRVDSSPTARWSA